MKTQISYSVFRLKKIFDSSQMCLEKIDFHYRTNSFDTEEQAIQAICDDEDYHYENLIVLKEVFVTKN